MTDEAESYEVKGVACVGALAFAEKVGLDAVRARMHEETRERLEPFYVASGWYDVDVLVDLMAATARVCGMPTSTLIRKHAARAARADVEGIYRASLSAGNLREMARRLPRAFNRYFRPCQATLIAVDDEGFEASLSPLPDRLESFFTAMNEGFVRGALETAGAERVRFTWVERRRIAPERLSLVFRAAWR